MSLNIAQAMITTDPAERDRLVNLEVLQHAVSRAIFCTITERVLDVRDAVYVTITVNGKTGASAYWGPAWDVIAERAKEKLTELGGTIEILDGRELHK